MAQKTDAQLTTDATVIRDETDAGENTATRVGGHMIDNIDSKINVDKIVDEDDMVSDSATLIPTQQSVKAYVDANVGGGAVDSVNGQTGVVVLDAGDVGADPAGTADAKVSDTAYDATSWNGVTDVAPSKNAVRDIIQTITPIGAQDLFISAPAMWPKATSGCSLPNPFEVGGTATVMSIDFDQATDENAQFQIVLPRNWNNGTVTVTVYWTATSGSGTVQFEVSAVAFSNDDPLSGSFGTAVVIDDTLITTSDVHISPTSSALTIGGSPADADFILFNIMRDVSDDSLNADARVLGIRITLTLDAGTAE